MSFVIPMYESERGWGSKIDGYAGPFETLEAANKFKSAYNLKFNNEKTVPDYYIMALEAEPYRGHPCMYRTDVDGVEFA